MYTTMPLCIYLQYSDIGREHSIHYLFDVGVLFLHSVGVLTNYPTVV